MDGKWSPAHQALLEQEACDLWLLTEVHVDARISDMGGHHTASLMGSKKTWAAIFSAAQATPFPDPHPASAMAEVEGIRFISSVLPWRGCGTPWEAGTHADRLGATLESLRPHVGRSSIWGGDWNQALEGPEYAGSLEGREHILSTMRDLRLAVPTRSLPSASAGHSSIDHIAVSVDVDGAEAYRIEAGHKGRRLSDHDAYVMTIV